MFVGSVLEGETMLVLAGFAANRGYLSLSAVLAVASLGATLGDQIFFFAGRRYGGALLRRFPGLQRRAETVNLLLRRYHGLVIIGVRFLYGMRIAGPVVIGMSRLPAWRFVLFNAIGAVLWALLVGGAGYLFGQTLQWLIGDLRRYEEEALLLIVVAALMLALARRLTKRD